MPTLEERVAALEAKMNADIMSASELRVSFAGLQDQMNYRFEQVDRRFEQVDRRFLELHGYMNQRFDAINQRIDRHFTWLVGIQVAVLVAVVGALIGSYYRQLWERTPSVYRSRFSMANDRSSLVEPSSTEA